MKKTICLIEQQIEKIALHEINLSIYLGAKVHSYNSVESASFDGCDLVIADCSESQLAGKTSSPIILISDELPQSDSIFSLPRECDLKSLIKTAAKILDVTAKEMAESQVPNFFPIPLRLFRFLGYAPYPIYKSPDGELLLESNHPIKTQILEKVGGDVLFINASNRVRFADSFSAQLKELAEKLQNEDNSSQEQLTCLDQSMSVIASRLQFSGMDDEVLILAKESIHKLEEIANKYDDAQELITDLYNHDTSHRYKNSQLMLFVSYHILKTLDWWIEKQREDMAYAVFFHDILFQSDSESLIRNEDGASKLILEHAAQTVDLTKQYPEVSKQALTIILQHHGKENGIGFAHELRQIDPLSRLFIICEYYTNIILAHAGGPIDQEATLSEMRELFNDKDSLLIIDALTSLDLETIITALTDDLDHETQLIEGVTLSQQDISQVVDEMEQEVQDDLKLLRFAADNCAGLPDIEQKKIISSTTQILNDLEKQVVKDNTVSEEEQETLIEGITEKIKDAAVIVKGCFQKEQKEPLSDVRDKSGRTKLMMAALSGNITLMESIVQESSNIKLTDSARKSALHYACINGSSDIISYLIDKGININGLDAKRRTPLFVAVNCGHLEAAKILLQKGAWPHVIADNGVTLIILATYKANFEMVKLLHEMKAPLGSRDHRNKSAIDYAKSLNLTEIFDYLQEATA